MPFSLPEVVAAGQELHCALVGCIVCGFQSFCVVAHKPALSSGCKVCLL